MARPTKATMNLSAFSHNYRLAKSLSPQSKAIAVVKADAYGHGVIEMAKSLANEADAFGVACIEEALELRESGIVQPILLLEGFFSEDELPLINQHDFWCAVHSDAQIEALARQPKSDQYNVWLKFDSGMHRLGFSENEYQQAYDKLNALPQVKNIVLMTHFACADELSSTMNQQQFSLCMKTFAHINAPVSMANSAATLHDDKYRLDYLRPGIMLYGASPFPDAHFNGDKLKPVMTLSSEVIAIRQVAAGESIGYGQRFVCDKSMTIGTVAIGYADGYPRHAKDGTPMMVDGHRTKLVGRVSMDMLMVDLTNIPNAKVGSSVELWGDHILAAEVAYYSDTIPYTLFTGITRRVKKEYISL
ncbi:alanine racemase [Vibrio rumoiensis]|uniref:Alanine racemase n=1 Tax=Vibrio rumoiensis 1S-45 TaxID=1188252 RepID=A0A1E5E6P0_9VIBR|nr:alanine racemase [Vibrio rumoiensis]OEF30134.1 alanine racemase [Vibrio rumoiensis 1S-45]